MGQSQSSGIVEKAIQEVEAQLRIMLMALDSRLGIRFVLGHPVIFWLVEYVSEIINRFKVQAHDNMTAYERKFGTKDLLASAEFGEAVHYMPLGGQQV